jgi:hypothetical protein
MANKFRGKIKAGEKPNLLDGQASRCSDTLEDLLSFNFKQLDPNQGQAISEWDERGLLCPLFQRLQNLSTQKAQELRGNNNSTFTIYGDFPSKSDFTHPKHVPEDAEWARFHLKGKEVVAGHLFRSVFYVVFLDAEHKFYITELKHT